MKILIAGASGATGRLVIEQLLNRGEDVTVIVRSPDKLPEFPKNSDKLSVISAAVSELSDAAMAMHVKDCDAVVSCLGHNLNLKGIYGHPRRLVTDATMALCRAIKANKPDKPIRFILMNTTGNRNRNLNEQFTLGEKIVMGLIRLLLPPQLDNEKAAEYLRTSIGQNERAVEWVALRPDNLTNEKNVTDYEIYPSPVRSAIFNAGQTSRINVASFMAELITDNKIWNKWKGQMPVIYNSTKETILE